MAYSQLLFLAFGVCFALYDIFWHYTYCSREPPFAVSSENEQENIDDGKAEVSETSQADLVEHECEHLPLDEEKVASRSEGEGSGRL